MAWLEGLLTAWGLKMVAYVALLVVLGWRLHRAGVKLANEVAEVHRLRQLLSNRDQTIADLSASVNRMKEAAAAQSFRLATVQTELVKAQQKWRATLASMQSAAIPVTAPEAMRWMEEQAEAMTRVDRE